MNPARSASPNGTCTSKSITDTEMTAWCPFHPQRVVRLWWHLAIKPSHIATLPDHDAVGELLIPEDDLHLPTTPARKQTPRKIYAGTVLGRRGSNWTEAQECDLSLQKLDRVFYHVAFCRLSPQAWQDRHI